MYDIGTTDDKSDEESYYYYKSNNNNNNNNNRRGNRGGNTTERTSLLPDLGRRRKKNKYFYDVSSGGEGDEEEEYYHTYMNNHNRNSSRFATVQRSQKQWDLEEDRFIEKRKQRHKSVVSTATTPRITTLNGAEEQTQLQKYNALSLIELRSSKKWKWSFCITSVLCVLLFLISSAIASYYIFFQPSYVSIDQLQVYHLPVDGWLGLQIVINCYNPNAVPISFSSLALELQLDDPTVAAIYPIAEPIEYNWNNSALVPRWSHHFLTVDYRVYIGTSPFFIQMQDLIMRKEQQGYRLQGKITTRIGAFYHTQRLRILQQYYFPLKGSYYSKIADAAV
jgi:LEA14-like dessication related protein